MKGTSRMVERPSSVSWAFLFVGCEMNNRLFPRTSLLSGAVILLLCIILGYFYPDFFKANIKDFTVNTVGAFLGFLGAYIVYRLQVIDNAEKEDLALLQRYREHLGYLTGIMADVLIYARNQSEALDELVVAIEKSPSEIQQLKFVASDSIGRLNRADNESAFHAYRKIFAEDPQRENTYRDLFTQMDMLTASLGVVKETFGHYRDGAYQRQLRLKELVQRIANETAMLLREIRMRPQAADFDSLALLENNKLNDILLVYVGLNARLVPFEIYFENFIEPLKYWLNDNNALLPQRGLELVMLAKDASVILTDLKYNTTVFIPAFDSQKIRVPLANLTALLERINSNIGTV